MIGGRLNRKRKASPSLLFEIQEWKKEAVYHFFNSLVYGATRNNLFPNMDTAVNFTKN
jgi:hypothetical protein